MKRSSGILAHPTSFPSKYGVGDLGVAAKKFLDFCYKAGAEYWQVLPLGPTSFGDSPYQSFSTFAGNTLLISPDLLADEGYLTQGDLVDIPKFDVEKVLYGEVITYKNTLYRKAYANFLNNPAHIQKAEFERFTVKQKSWLDDYSLFLALKNYFIEQRRFDYESEELLKYKELNKDLLSPEAINDYYYGAVWNTWPEELINREKSAISHWTEKLADEIGFIKFMQYEFFRQWAKIREYANGLCIQVIGDIPIFVALDSSDVWANTELFHIDEKGYPSVVAGVPPDYFSETGQLWGNPLYNWKAHAEEDFKWWTQRIANTLGFVDILRIDHFRGFDEYWEVPYGQRNAIIGNWRKGPGIALFDAIKRELGRAPIIAEDLGLLTDSVTELRLKAGFPGMKVLQFAFGSDSANDYLPHSYTDTNSIVYTGTHDNDTTKGWYETATDKEKNYYHRYMNVSGDDVNWDFIRLAFQSCAKLAIIPVQDLLGLGSEARMNKPGVSSGWWQFRYTDEMLQPGLADGLLYLGELFNRVAEHPKTAEEKEADK